MADKPLDPRIERMLATLETLSAGLDAPLPDLPGTKIPPSSPPGFSPPGRRPVSRRFPSPAQTPIWLPGSPETPPPQAQQKLTEAIDRLSARIVNLEQKLSEREPPHMRSNVPPKGAQYGAAAAPPPERRAQPEPRAPQPPREDPRGTLSRSDTAPVHRAAERPPAAPPHMRSNVPPEGAQYGAAAASPHMRSDELPDAEQYGAAAAPTPVTVLAPDTLSTWLYFAAGALSMAGVLFLAQTAPWKGSAKPSSVRGSPPANSISFPAEKPVGLLASRGSYTAFDEKTLQLVRVDSNGRRVVSARGFPFQDTAGLTGGSDGLWTVNSNSAQITLHDPNTYEVLSRFPAPGEAPSAVHFDGTDLWTADFKTGRVYQHSVENGLIVASESPVSEGRPVGLHRQGNQLWILDADTRSIGRYDIGDKLAPAGRASLRRHLPETCSITGFAVVDQWVWVITQNPSELRRIDARRLFQ